MDNAIKNRNIYLAKKLLKFVNNPTKEISFVSTKPKILSVSKENLPKLLPGLTKQEISEILSVLERVGVLKSEKKYTNPADEYSENNEDKDYNFNITLQPKKIEKFISMSESDVFGFKFFNAEYCKSLLEIFNMLINSEVQAIKISDFFEKISHENSSYEILKKISDFSDSISIQKKDEVEYETGDFGEPQLSGSVDVPDVIVIRDKKKLKKILDTIKQRVEDVDKNNVAVFLEEDKKLEWLCRKCKRWFGSFTSEQEITQWLDKFSNGRYMVCRRCRSKNFFIISHKGKVNFLMVKEK